MRQVEPQVYLIGMTTINRVGVLNWLNDIGAGGAIDYLIPDEEKMNMGARLVQLAAKRCYMSYEVGLNPNIAKVRKDLEAFITNILRVGHGCYDGETEVLTVEGWKHWPDVSKEDKFATLNSKGALQYHEADRLIAYDYKGPMYLVTGQVDLKVTPNHKMLVCPTTTAEGRKKDWDSYELIAASEIDDTSTAYLKTLPFKPSCDKDSEFYALGQFYGFSIGDGSVKGQYLDFHLRKRRKIVYLTELCDILDFNLRHIKDTYIVDTGDFRWLHQLYNEEGAKEIQLLWPWELAPSDFLWGLLDGLRNSDGSENSQTGFCYDTTSEVLAGQVQVLAMRLGLTANISQAECYQDRAQSFGDKPVYRLIVSSRTVKPVVNKMKGSTSFSCWEKDWQGRVYCAEVPNNTLYVRRDGKPVWSGNSVLEHAVFSFALENVSRVFTAELNRHRAGMAISEGSMRYIAFTDIPFWMPDSIKDNPDDPVSLSLAKRRSRAVFMQAFEQAQTNYEALTRIWDENAENRGFAEKKKLTSLFRRIIPIGVATGGVWSGNLRALRHIFTLRSSPHAEEEICLIASQMLKVMMAAEPLIFKDFKLVEGYWTPTYVKV